VQVQEIGASKAVERRQERELELGKGSKQLVDVRRIDCGCNSQDCREREIQFESRSVERAWKKRGFNVSTTAMKLRRVRRTYCSRNSEAES
jgi:hypothetical protein